MQLSRSAANVLKQGKNFQKLVDHEKSLKDETESKCVGQQFITTALNNAW